LICLKMVETFYKFIYFLEDTYTYRILLNFFNLVVKISPYFFTSVIIGVILVYYFPKKKILINTENETLSIFIAGIIGLLSPLPTYVAVPVGISLISIGIPFSVIMVFIIASPLMNPSVFYLTFTLLGAKIAIARIISAYVIALSAGFLSKIIFKSTEAKFENRFRYNYAGNRSIIKEFWHYFIYMVKYFMIAILIGAAVKALVPPEVISYVLGGQAKTSLLIAIAMGVPLYTCGGAAIPLIQILIDMGMNKGAVLAFFISGPATKLETIYIYKSILGIRILIFYLLLTFTGSLLAGLVFLKVP
jgi:uncharacterized membrane protein YraQ (UPF0718 family)